MTKDNDELMPCPFCGEQPRCNKDHYSHGGKSTYISCTYRGCIGSSIVRCGNHAFAIKAWNTRPTPTQSSDKTCKRCNDKLNHDDDGANICRFCDQMPTQPSGNMPDEIWVRQKVSDIDVYPATGTYFDGCYKYIRAELSQPKGDVDDIKLEWRKGEPPRTHRNNWFIAKTKHRDRVVLRALPEENSYDYQTADETYIKADQINAWMQFPDSEFVEPEYESRALKERIIAFEINTTEKDRVMKGLANALKEIIEISDRNHLSWAKGRKFLAEYDKLGGE